MTFIQAISKNSAPTHNQQGTSAPVTKTKQLTSAADGCAQSSSPLGRLIPE